MKNNKHDKITGDYQKTKSKHLDKLATQMLENEEKFRKLGEKKTKGKFLDLF
jgi:hypothetical protein